MPGATVQNEGAWRLASVGQHAQTVHLVVDLVPPDVRLHALPDLRRGDRPSSFALADPEDLLGADTGQLRGRLLAAVYAKRGQEAWEADERCAGIAEAQQQVPVQREAERLVH